MSALRTFVRVSFCTVLVSSSVWSQTQLTSDRSSYAPGEIAIFTGSGFAADESVTLVVARQDGSPATGSAHLTWSVVADSSGGFTTPWTVCGDDCIGQILVASAVGDVSGIPADTEFLNHECGDGVVTSVVPVGGACSAFTPAVGMGPDNYEVQEGGTYVMTIEGVTECSGDTITVFVQSSSVGNFCFDATGGGGTYVGTFTMPDPACFTMPVSYKCGADAACSHSGSFGAQGPSSGCGGVHLRTSFFDGSCNVTGADEDCSGGCTPCTLVCPSDVTVDCSESTDPSATGTPTGCEEASYEDEITPGACAGSYVITRTWSADDGCMGTATCVQTITVTDLTPPEITCPSDVSVVGCCMPVDIGMATATDDCSGVTITNDAPPEFCEDTVVTWTATDGCGNTSTCEQMVTVSPCVLVCPPDLTVDCGDSLDPSNTGTPTGCEGATFEDVVTPGACAGSYVITRTWSADDLCGGTSTCDQTITVTDTTAPEITCPDDITIVGCCVAPDIGMAMATDDCSDVVVTKDAPEEFCLGTTVVTWTATDECGNSTSCEQLVTVTDVTLDFEADGLGAGLLHGQSLDTVGPEAPFSCVTITSGPDSVTPGDGNNGAAIFDSTNGPFGQDPDLNVGLGNVLYVQANGGQPDLFTGVNGPDTWDHPNDDEDGGTLTFDFCTGVQAKSIRLIDIDLPAPDQGATVTLTDGNGLTRTYTVPAGWTADGPGAAAVGLLLLDTDLPQPGVGSIATAATDAGYDPDDVVQVKVRFGSSGACDDLTYCPNGPEAAVVSRNGSGINPNSLTAGGMPVLGTQWSASLDCAPLRSGMATLAIRDAAVPGILTPAGETLIGGELVHRIVQPYARGASQLRWSIPFDLSLVGLEVHVQGLCLETGGIGPKIRQHRAQLSNALDLTLGF